MEHSGQRLAVRTYNVVIPATEVDWLIPREGFQGNRVYGPHLLTVAFPSLKQQEVRRSASAAICYVLGTGGRW